MFLRNIIFTLPGIINVNTTINGTLTVNGAVSTTVTDAVTNTTTDVATLTHLTSGTAAASFGTGLLFRGEDAGGTTENMMRLSSIWTDASAASEDSAFIISLRTAGAALAEAARFTANTLTFPGATATITNTSGSLLLASGGIILSQAGIFKFSDNTGFDIRPKITTATSAAIAFLNDPNTAAQGFSASSGTQTFVSFTFTVNQSGTAAFNGLRVNATETAVGSGVRSLLLLQRSSADVFDVRSLGQIISTGIAVSTGAMPTLFSLTTASHVNVNNTTDYNHILLDINNDVTYVGGAATVASFFGINVVHPILNATTAGFTVTTASTLYISNAPVEGSGNIAITNPYAIFVDAGIARFDGNGVHVFSIDADTTAPGAATGRIPIKDTSTGGTRYIMVSDT